MGCRSSLGRIALFDRLGGMGAVYEAIQEPITDASR